MSTRRKNKEYSSYAESQAQRRRDVLEMQAADRAEAAAFRRGANPRPPPMQRAFIGFNETKYFDTAFSQTVASAADWTGTEVPCTAYIQNDGTTVGAYTDSALIPSSVGAGYGQVNGNKYLLKRLRVKGQLVPALLSDQADVAAPISTRVVLVMDTQPQGAQAQGESVFTDMGSAVQCNFSFLAMAAGSGGRFKILKDKIYTHQPAVAGTDGASTVSFVRTGNNFKFNVNFPQGLQVMLKASSATPNIAALSNINIFLLAHSSGTNGAAVISGCARAYYQD